MSLINEGMKKNEWTYLLDNLLMIIKVQLVNQFDKEIF